MNGFDWKEIRGFFIDLDGVMYIDEQVIDGAIETVLYLKERGIPHRFLTNTTVQSIGNLYNKLIRLGIPVEKHEIISPPVIAAEFLQNQGQPSVYLVLKEETKEDFAGFRENVVDPDFVIVGKIGDRWNYDLMNHLFHFIIDGSQLIALHKDRYTMGTEGLHIEYGAFIEGLEYATGKKALVIGKPTPRFYQAAIDSIGLPPRSIAMIGDDLVSDIQGAQQMGIRSVLVKTGKYRDDLLVQSEIQPEAILSSVAELPRKID